MNNFRTILKKLKFFLILRSNLLILILSITALSSIFFNINDIDITLGISGLLQAQSFINILNLLSSVYVILFIPTYPIFFIILKKKNFTNLEKLSFTIISNLVFYILIAYFGYYTGFLITGPFFFVASSISFFSLILIIICFEFKYGKSILLRANKVNIQNIDISFSFNFIKKYFQRNINGMLLVFFLILVCLLNFIRFSYWYGTDAMYHAVLIKAIVKLNKLPVDQYYGAVGLHVFGSVIHFFSGLDIIYIPRYFLFYTIFLSALLLHALFKKVFRNNNLSYFGIFILEFSTIGFSNMMYQFWPTSLAMIQCLFIFYLLYIRLQNFIQLEKPTKTELLSNLFLFYVLIILTFISSLLTHSLITILLISSILYVYFLYFIKDYKRGIDLLLLCGLFGIFWFFFSIDLISEHFFLIEINNYPRIFIIIIIPVLLIISWRLKRSIHFTTGRFSRIIKGEKQSYYKTIEKKFLLPLITVSIIIFLLILFIFNHLILDINSSKYLLGFEVFIIILFGFWGLILFQKKPRGKPFFLWFLSFSFILLAALINDIFVVQQSWSGRISLLFAPIIVIGFISYIYKIIRMQVIKEKWIKIFLIGFTILLFSAQFYDQLVDVDGIEYNLKKREVNSIQWISSYTDDHNLIFSEFGISYVFMYFDYPFDTNKNNFNGYSIHHFFTIFYSTFDMFDPDEHYYESGVNILQSLKDIYNTDVYLVLDDNYLTMRGFEVYKRLTEDDMVLYNNMGYLNKFLSSKSEYGVEVPYYWVI